MQCKLSQDILASDDTKNGGPLSAWDDDRGLISRSVVGSGVCMFPFLLLGESLHTCMIYGRLDSF